MRLEHGVGPKLDRFVEHTHTYLIIAPRCDSDMHVHTHVHVFVHDCIFGRTTSRVPFDEGCWAEIKAQYSRR